jgi:hypothetical protein
MDNRRDIRIQKFGAQMTIKVVHGIHISILNIQDLPNANVWGG